MLASVSVVEGLGCKVILCACVKYSEIICHGLLTVLFLAIPKNSIYPLSATPCVTALLVFYIDSAF